MAQVVKARIFAKPSFPCDCFEQEVTENRDQKMTVSVFFRKTIRHSHCTCCSQATGATGLCHLENLSRFFQYSRHHGERLKATTSREVAK